MNQEIKKKKENVKNWCNNHKTLLKVLGGGTLFVSGMIFSTSIKKSIEPSLNDEAAYTQLKWVADPNDKFYIGIDVLNKNNKVIDGTTSMHTWGDAIDIASRMVRQVSVRSGRDISITTKTDGTLIVNQ